jgi:hypothetical protein
MAERLAEMEALIYKLWNFIENDGGSTEFFVLREQVRGIQK